MHPRQVAREGRVEAFGIESVDFVQLIGPGHAIARHFPDPATEPGEILRVTELALTQPQRFLRGVGLRHVPGHLGEAREGAVGSVQRRDHDVRTEQVAVLPDAPPLIPDAPFRGGLAQQALRLAGRPVLFREEPGERLPQNLFRGVSFDPLRPRVPGNDPARLVEREDGVIADALDQQLEQSGVTRGRFRPRYGHRLYGSGLS